MGWLLAGLVIVYFYVKSRGAAQAAGATAAPAGTLQGSATATTSIPLGLPAEVTPSPVAPGAHGFEMPNTLGNQAFADAVLAAVRNGPTSPVSTLGAAPNRISTGGADIGYFPSDAAAATFAQNKLGSTYKAGRSPLQGVHLFVVSRSFAVGNGYNYSVTWTQYQNEAIPSFFVAPAA